MDERELRPEDELCALELVRRGVLGSLVATARGACAAVLVNNGTQSTDCRVDSGEAMGLEGEDAELIGDALLSLEVLDEDM